MKLGRRACVLGAIGGISVGWMAGGALSHSSPPEKTPVQAKIEIDPRELYTVVEDQISAIRHNNFQVAYQFAAQGIREKFPLEQFSDMVRKTYPRLMHPGSVNFGVSQFSSDTQASTIIYLNDREGASPMIYAFVKEGGKWKIEGVQLLQSTGIPLTIDGPQA